MPASLIESQLEILEVPSKAIYLEVSLTTNEQINQLQPNFRRQIKLIGVFLDSV